MACITLSAAAVAAASDQSQFCEELQTSAVVGSAAHMKVGATLMQLLQ